MRVPHVAGPPMAPAAQEGRQAMGKRGVAGVVQAPLPLPALPQGVHGARPGLWAQEEYHQQAQEDGDRETGRAVAVVAGERQIDVQRMLERHAPRETVRAVAIDLAEAYRQAVELVMPDAAIVADKFHVLALAGRALHDVHGETR